MKENEATYDLAAWEHFKFLYDETPELVDFKCFLILRLARLLRKRQDYFEILSLDDWRMKLFNRAIYSTYVDARNYGLGEDAKALLSRDDFYRRRKSFQH